MAGWEMVDCEKTLMEEIADPSMKRRDVAQSYALTLKSSDRNRVDWARVNKAIIERWSSSALQWIKSQAWSGKCFKEQS